MTILLSGRAEVRSPPHVRIGQQEVLTEHNPRLHKYSLAIPPLE